MKQVMEERNIRVVIVDCIIRKNPDEETRHQLYVLQTLLLNLLQDKMRTRVEAQDQKSLEKIIELRKIAFDVHGPSQQRNREDWYDYTQFTNSVLKFTILYLDF